MLLYRHRKDLNVNVNSSFHNCFHSRMARHRLYKAIMGQIRTEMAKKVYQNWAGTQLTVYDAISALEHDTRCPHNPYNSLKTYITRDSRMPHQRIGKVLCKCKPGHKDFIDVYTDGASSPNRNGGWAYWVSDELSNSGNAKDTTNQRMELTAALKAMLEIEDPIVIYSDSQYVVKGFNNKWYEKWIKNGWVSSYKKPVANKDLWEEMIEIYLENQNRIIFQWIKGHSGIHGNEMADKLAVSAKEILNGKC